MSDTRSSSVSDVINGFGPLVVSLALAIGFFVYSFTTGTGPFAQDTSDATKLYVLPIAYGDALIIESDGMFGIIDSGEGEDYPDGSDPRYPWRDGIATDNGVEYLLFPLLDKLGVSAEKGNLLFYIGTHPHSDHIGSGWEVIEKYHPKYVYTPYYDDSMINNENALWDNQYAYDRLITAAKENGCVLIQSYRFDEKTAKSDKDMYSVDADGTIRGATSFMLGSARIDLKGFHKPIPSTGVGDANAITLEVLMTTKNGYRTFFAGDVESMGPDEEIIAKTVGEVDVLKLGHHGNEGAGSKAFITSLSPEFAIQTGSEYSLSGETTRALMDVKAKYYPTSETVDLHLDALVFTYADSGIQVNMPSYDLGQWG